MSYVFNRQARARVSSLITALVILAQITLPLGALVAAIQPTPQMAQAAAQQAGLSDWFANAAGELAAAGQWLWGAPQTAQAATPLTVTINQKSGQADPTGTVPVVFTVVFSALINTATFTTADISTAGSTATGITVNSITQVAPNDGTTFEVAIAATGAGTIVATIPAATYAYVGSTFATTGNAPEFIATDAAGNFYVTNNSANTVSKITPAGVSTIFATVGTIPYGLAFDASGNLYTANYGSDSVSKITPAGVSTIFATWSA